MVSLVAVTGVSVFGIADMAIFGVIGIMVNENVSVAKDDSAKDGVGLPEVPDRVPLSPRLSSNNQNPPLTPKINTTKPSNIGRMSRFATGFPKSSLVIWTRMSGGNGRTILRANTGQLAGRLPVRQNER